MGLLNPSFVGERLIEAREARGLNGSQLAEELGLSRQAISLYENGKRTPTADVLNNMARVLRFPPHRFSRPMQNKAGGPLFFRSFSSATKSARIRANRRLGWVRDDICGYLRTIVEFPGVNLPNLTIPDDPTLLTDEDIESLATQTRRYWGLGDGPISDVVLLLENNGAIVVQQELGVQTLDAFSIRDLDGDTPYFVISTDKKSAVRSRFNAAHELAHMLLHRYVRPGGISITDNHKVFERQAHLFAAAFLMPESTFTADLIRPSLQGFVSIKTRWRVSIAAMIRRAKTIGLITQEDETRLMMYLSQRGWKKLEPYDDEIEVEKPQFIERSFDLILSECIATKSSIEADTALYAADIERAVGLDEGYFDDDIQHYKFPKLMPFR